MNPLLAAVLTPLIPQVAQGAKTLIKNIGETFSEVLSSVETKASQNPTMTNYLSQRGIYTQHALQEHISELSQSLMGDPSQPHALVQDVHGRLWLHGQNGSAKALDPVDPAVQTLHKLCAIRDYHLENPHLSLGQAGLQLIPPKGYFALKSHYI